MHTHTCGLMMAFSLRASLLTPHGARPSSLPPQPSSPSPHCLTLLQPPSTPSPFTLHSPTPSGPKLLEIVSAFPASAKALRRTTIHLALRRELVLIAKNDAANEAAGTNGERGVERRISAEPSNLRGRILEAINTGAPAAATRILQVAGALLLVAST